jgi:GntR family transcriptional repressor for pyruvate dehydrogenase complex
MTVPVSPRAYHLIATSRRAPHRVAHALIERIRSCVYPRGSLLPKEADLLREFSVSRPVLREALTILQCLGLVDARRSVGMKVLGGQDGTTVLSQATVDLGALLEACCVFEAESIALVAGLSSKIDLPARACPRLGIDEVLRFHTALAQATGNGAVLASVTGLWNLVSARPAFKTVFIAAMRPAKDDVLRLQACVIDAVARSDPDAARDGAKALFNLYLTRVFDVEEQERLRQVRQESQDLRSIWGGRLRAGAASQTRPG